MSILFSRICTENHFVMFSNCPFSIISTDALKKTNAIINLKLQCLNKKETLEDTKIDNLK